MKKILHLGLVCLLVSLFSIHSALAAETTQSFNTVIVPVSDQSSAEFKKALSQGFTEILIRLTGNTTVATLPMIKRTITHAQQYVQYYRYLSTTDSDNSPTASALHLQITFNIQAVRALLTQADIPIWSQNNRPTTLVWIKTIQDNHVQFLSSTVDDQLSSTLYSLSTQYGLPILLPAMDLQDIQLSTQFIDQGIQSQYSVVPNIDAIKEFMHRYRVNSILIGNITENTASHQLSSQWQLLFMHEMYQWSSLGDNSTDLIKQAFKNTINILTNYALNENGNSQEKIIFLRIFNVNNLGTYTELSKYIEQFNKIKQISLENLSQTSVTFKLTLTDDSSTKLIQYLSRNQELQFIKQENTPVTAKQQNVQNIIPTLYYDYGQTTTTQYQT
jgi:hypothetical protein